MFGQTKLLKIKPIYLGYAVVIAVLLAAGAYLQFGLPWQATADIDVAKVVATMGKGEKSVFEDVRDSMKPLIAQYGIEGMIAINEYAIVNNLYGIYQCHVISHMTGHEAVVYYGQDYETVIAHDNHFCEVGYRHGAEAQVALSGGDYQHELYKMCDVIKKKNPDADCFHGAGHAFMGETLDVNKSLEMCDGLIDEDHPEEAVLPCYNAVFAELTNLVGGTDGGTGIRYTGEAPLEVAEESSLEYCSKFGKLHYQEQCLFEFSGLGISDLSTPKEVNVKLQGCSNEDYELYLEIACIKSVSAVGAQHLLAKNHTLDVPEFVLALDTPLREAYIKGAGTEMKQYIVSGAVRDNESFCNSFTEDSDIELCTAIFSNI
jgi:hypothetical protein